MLFHSIKTKMHFKSIVTVSTLLLFLLIIQGCESTSLNFDNYLACRHLLEEDRQEIRKTNDYSYRSQAYDECRAPARYRMEVD